MAIAISATRGASAYPPDSGAIAALYREMMLELREAATQRLVRDARKLTAEALRRRRLIAEAAQILQDYDTEAAQWIAEEIPKAYLRGARIAEQGLAEIGLPSIGAMDTVIHREAIQVLVNNTLDDLTDVTRNAEKHMRTMVRKTQQSAAVDKLLTKEVAKGIGAGKARRDVSKELYRVLIDEYADKPIVAGARKFSADYYAELVARTMTREAQTAGTVNRTLEAGVDLVMITAHGADDGCGFYEGKIFSISGTHEKYPPLSSLPNGGPPFHPNCKHSTAPFVEDLATGAEKRRGAGVDEAALGKSYKEVEKLAKKRKAA